MRWQRAGFPATGVPPCKIKPRGTLGRCQNAACDRLVRQTRCGYCSACFQRWRRQGRPATGPTYCRQSQAGRRLPDHVPVTQLSATPRGRRRQQCDNCRRYIVGDRLCPPCRRYQNTHGTPRPVPRYALHTGAVDCHCRSCAGRRAYANRTRPNRPYDHHHAWESTQEARLRELAGTLTLAEIAALLTAEFGIPRTALAVRVRCTLLRLSAQLRDLSGLEVAGILGVNPQCITRWLTSGLLAGRRQTPSKPQSPWAVTPVALEAFIRAHPECYDWQRVKAGRWRALAEGEWRRDPLYTLTEAARWLGVGPWMVGQYIRQGRLMAGQRPDRVRFACWYVRRSALVRFQQQRQIAQEIAS